jgi:hypothetical protein
VVRISRALNFLRFGLHSSNVSRMDRARLPGTVRHFGTVAYTINSH